MGGLRRGCLAREKYHGSGPHSFALRSHICNIWAVSCSFRANDAPFLTNQLSHIRNVGRPQGNEGSHSQGRYEVYTFVGAYLLFATHMGKKA
jgi:hypothetical protein